MFKNYKNKWHVKSMEEKSEKLTNERKKGVWIFFSFVIFCNAYYYVLIMLGLDCFVSYNQGVFLIHAFWNTL